MQQIKQKRRFSFGRSALLKHINRIGFGSVENIFYEMDIIERDDIGRILEKEESVLGFGTESYKYFYDDIGKLEDVCVHDGQSYIYLRHYEYDSNGNRLHVIDCESQSIPCDDQHECNSGTQVNGYYDEQDRLTDYGSTEYGYTENGELLTKTISQETTTYTYDEFGNLINVDPNVGAPGKLWPLE